MDLKDYSEYELVEKPAINLFKSLGYEHQNCFNEKFGSNGTLGRDTASEIVLKTRLKSSLLFLNPDITTEAIDLAIEELTKNRSTLNPIIANRDIYKMLKDGIKVSIRLPDGNEEVESVKVIDFDNTDNNDFFLASQFWISGDMYKRRADLIGFVNGLPLIFIELKASHKKLKNAFDDNLKDYRDTIPDLFCYNAFIVLSNGSKSKIGTISSSWEHFNEWKKISSEGEEGIVSLETIIKGTCEKQKFLDILENFTLFQDKGSLIKVIAKNHQFLGVNNAIDSFKKIKEKKGKLGVFWHTQGSGKSFSMIFFSQKILRKFEGNYTFLIVTDAIDLDDQIYTNFESVGAVTEKEIHAKSGNHLKQLLSENHRNIFTLIQKFRTKHGEKYPEISKRSDIIVIADEAHRTQYDVFAMNMRTALPNAAFIAFTGTPLMVGEEKTKKTFGDYVSVYNFKQSVDDKATVPIYYENRIPEVQLKNKDLNEDLERIVEDSMLDDEQEAKLEREFAREYHLITRNDRLEKIAEDIVDHFINRGHQGKAMVVSIDKPTTVKMYDKVQNYWKKYIEKLESDLELALEEKEKEIIRNRINFMKETDMAVVVSPEQNELDKFRKLGLEIKKHRERMNKEKLSDKFKDEDDPFRIVFVCAMWMTGFDVPSLSTLYLDKPIRNHTLMQTISRANRVFEGKKNGLIVDYIGIFRDLKKALAIYGSTGGIDKIDSPVKPKSELIKELKESIDETRSFCEEKGINVQKIIDAIEFEKIELLDEAVDLILVNDESKIKYISLSNNVGKLYKAILPDPDAGKFSPTVSLFKVILSKIRALSPEIDVSHVMDDVEKLLDSSLETLDYEKDHQSRIIDLSKINLDVLRKYFHQGRKNTQTEILKNAIKKKLNDMIRKNPTRIDFLEKFQKIIDEYNSGAKNIETSFEELIDFFNDLENEEKRNITENLTEEELALFDLLYKPDLTEKEKNRVKLTAKNLLHVLKEEKLVLDWRNKQQTNADVIITIKECLDKCLPRSYTPEIYQERCNAVYQHIYESYYGDGKSLYSVIS